MQNAISGGNRTAVEYAHSLGVWRRDLKPGNAMLGKHDEALAVDWGLVKVALQR